MISPGTSSSESSSCSTPPRMILAIKPQTDIDSHGKNDHCHLNPFTQQTGQNRRRDQDKNKRAGKLHQKKRRYGRFFPILKMIAAKKLEPGASLFFGDSVRS